MIQIKTIQTFRTLQVLNDNRKEKDSNFTFYILLQAWVFIQMHSSVEEAGESQGSYGMELMVSMTLVVGKCRAFL